MRRKLEKPVLLLSIQAPHAERIFNGLKTFELRKTLPKAVFEKVYLYESGGRGIIGCFDVNRVLRDPIGKLWNLVGERATSRERFFAYFSKWENGYAIEIANPVRFQRPLARKLLKRLIPSFTAPLSYSLVEKGTRLFSILKKGYTRNAKSPLVHLQEIGSGEKALYQQLVTKEISPKYDELTERFSEAILDSHSAGYDSNGVFTKRKLVLTVKSKSGQLIGFTTLTFKRGGSVKTGPTILLPRFRHHGYGLALRHAVEENLRNKGVRKIYCTCPANDLAIIKHLLTAGYQIEAHLDKHYSRNHGELIFGKFLPTLTAHKSALSFSRRCLRAYPTYPSSSLAKKMSRFLHKWFLETWAPIEKQTIDKIIRRSSKAEGIAYEKKPVRLLCLMQKQNLCGALVLSPKRGGAIKALCFFSTNHKSTIHRLFDVAEKQATDWGKRKIYVLHPADDHLIIRILKGRGYRTEGILREPYRPQCDVLVLSKFVPLSLKDAPITGHDSTAGLIIPGARAAGKSLASGRGRW